MPVLDIAATLLSEEDQLAEVDTSWLVPSAKCATARMLVLVPTFAVNTLGFREIDAGASDRLGVVSDELIGLGLPQPETNNITSATPAIGPQTVRAQQALLFTLFIGA